MDFSELVKHSGLAYFSPDGQLVATTDQHRVVVRNSDSLAVLRTFACLDVISELEWSPDSGYLLASQLKRKIVQVFSVADPAWTCKIDEALAGLTHACWAPDSRHILTRSDFNLRLSIWSLSRKAVTYIRTPKLMPAAPGAPASEDGIAMGGHGAVKFSHGGTLMAVLTRVDCKDVMSIYSVAEEASGDAMQSPRASASSGWDLLKQFHIDTEDCVQFEWSPNDAHILCVDSSLTYNMCVYTPSGQQLASYRAYEHALGIKGTGQGVRWSPRNSFLAIGSYDQQVRIFNNATWSLVHSYVHSNASVNGTLGGASAAAARSKSSNVVLYVEKPIQPNHAVSRLAMGATSEMADEKENMEESIAEQSFASGDGAGTQRGVVKKVGAGPSAAAPRSRLASATAASRPGSAVSRRAGTAAAASSSGPLSARSRIGMVTTPQVEVEKPTICVPSKYSIESLPVSLPSLTPAIDKPDPKLGVGLVSWSSDERYLLTRNDNMPSTVWVWDTQRLGLTSLLVQMEAVRCAAWDPKRTRFAMCTGTPKLYLWSPEGCSIVDVPLQQEQAFNVRRLEWSHDGQCILLMDKNKFCCCYMRE